MTSLKIMLPLLIIVVIAVIVNTTTNSNADKEPFFSTRGIVLSIDDLDGEMNWPKIAKDAGLTTIATHITPSEVAEFIQSPKGQQFLQSSKELGIEIEHELHAINDLLPPELFKVDSTMFRMNKEGRRVADYNLCVHSEKALDIVSENAVKYAKILTPTTHRYFYWIDDGMPMCYCQHCSKYSDSEQALILENRIIKALREFDPKAKLAHLAYHNTLEAPVKVKPEPGIFLEFAPIHRSWDYPLSQLEIQGPRYDEYDITHGQTLELLDENLEVFGKKDAQVLEYWIDVSLFSNWEKPAVKLPWNRHVFLNDINTYAKRGIKNITSFGVYIDEEYKEMHKDLSFIEEYGTGLKNYKFPK